MADRILFDTNVLLDVMLEERDPSGCAAALYERAIRGEAMGFLFPGSLKDIEYIARKDLAAGDRRAWIAEFLGNLSIAPFDRKTCKRALEADEPDYEDGLMHAAAELAGCTHMITRDARAYLSLGPMIEKMTPEQYMGASRPRSSGR